MPIYNYSRSQAAIAAHNNADRRMIVHAEQWKGLDMLSQETIAAMKAINESQIAATCAFCFNRNIKKRYTACKSGDHLLCEGCIHDNELNQDRKGNCPHKSCQNRSLAHLEIEASVADRMQRDIGNAGHNLFAAAIVENDRIKSLTNRINYLNAQRRYETSAAASANVAASAPAATGSGHASALRSRSGEVAKAQEGQEAQGEEGGTAVRHDGDP